MKSVMQHQFSKVPNVSIPRSSFDRSHGHKTSFDAGYLIPVLVDEALPGDTFNTKMTAFARMSTPAFPVMDNLYMDVQFFAIPIRLIWDNFQKFMGEQDNPGDSTDYLVPTMTSPGPSGYAENSLHDYMGIPTKQRQLEHSSLFHRAYNLVWNTWYRDQNLQDSIVVDKGDGPDTHTDYVLKRRGKRHDYFTSCLPWPQKGESVDLPLGTVAPIEGIGKINQNYLTSGTVYETAGSGTTAYAGYSSIDNSVADTQYLVEEDPNNSGYPGIYANLSEATAATINQLRQAFQIQRLLEKDARGGTRYTEIIKAHFGVTSPDARLQRPEYLGGGSTPVNINPVVATTGFTGDKQIGDLGAFSTTVINNNGFTKSFTEHSIILGLLSVRADLTYQQGLNRMFSRSTRYDYYWPSLAQIGEQAVLNKEILAEGTFTVQTDDDVFGYIERYAEYRYKPSIITGQFRSNAAAPLDAWHLSQEFTTQPVLDNTFIEENPPIDRVINVPSEPHFIFDSYFSMRCVRPMPLYGVPGLIDHF